MKLNVTVVIAAFCILTFSACGDQDNLKNVNAANNSTAASSGQGIGSETPSPTPVATPKETILPEFKAGEDYKTSVRPKMLKAGWKYYSSPDAQKCGSGDPTCDEYPEMEACAGTGMGNCKFMWIKGDKLASIYTVDDPYVYQNSEIEDAPKNSSDADRSGIYEYGYDHESGRDEFEYELRKDNVAIYSESREGGGIDDQRGTWKYDPVEKTISVKFGSDEYIFTVAEKGIKLIKEPNEPEHGAKGFTGQTFQKK